MSFTTASFEEYRDYEKAIAKLGGGVVEVQSPAVDENGAVQDDITNAYGGPGVKKFIDEQGGDPVPMQVRVERAHGDRKISDWVSFDEGTMFVSSST